MDEMERSIHSGTVVVSMSGGKDSLATELHLRELGIPHRRIAVNTGWEEAGWNEYVFGYLQGVVGDITELRADVPLTESQMARIRLACRDDNPLVLDMLSSPMVRLVLSKAMFPSRVKKFCTDHLKLAPIKTYLADLDNPVSVVGIRAEESAKRAEMTEWEWSPGLDCWIWRPIIRWSEADVIAIIKRHGIRPNPLYLADHSRVGCWPCIEAAQSEIRLISQRDPLRFELIRQLERVVNRIATWEMRGRGQSLNHRRTFYQSLGKYDKNKKGVAVPGSSVPGSTQPLISDVVRWALTGRGAPSLVQENLFVNLNSGCMKWGLCDGPAAAKRS